MIRIENVPKNVLRRVVVDPISGCWNAKSVHKEYGQVKMGGRSHRMHVLVFASCVEDILPGNHVHHKCENKACCNPEHLEQLTPSQHRRKVTDKITHCPKGHAYTAENTYFAKSGRICRTCSIARKKEPDARAYQRAYSRAHRARQYQRAAEWRSRHPERAKAIARKAARAYRERKKALNP